MLKFRASDFHKASTTIQSIESHIKGVIAAADDGNAGLEQVSAENRGLVVRRLTRLENVSAGLSIPVTLDGIRLLKKHIDVEKRPLNYTELRSKLSEISDRLTSELKSTVMLILKPDSQHYYEPADPLFGAEVAAKFPSALYEIEEAGKCYSLERSTASAFHSIRCLECGIRALSRCLGIPDPTKASQRSWMKLLGELKEEIDRRWPTNSQRMSDDGEFFDNAYAALAAMQNPWRNATMHLDQKYTPDEARHIFEVVRGFMKRIADRIDERGEPLA